MQFVIIRFMGRINCAKRVPKDLKNTDVTPVFKKDNPVLEKKKRFTNGGF